jgi:hypothetical protein
LVVNGAGTVLNVSDSALINPPGGGDAKVLPHELAGTLLVVLDKSAQQRCLLGYGLNRYVGGGGGYVSRQGAEPNPLRIADGGTATLGIIYVMSGLGTGLGPLVVRRWLGDAPRRLLTGITLGGILLAVGIGGLSAAPTLGLFLLATLLRTVGSGTVWVFSAALPAWP